MKAPRVVYAPHLLAFLLGIIIGISLLIVAINITQLLVINEVEVFKGPHGDEYRHPDRQTTDVLNYLSGKSTLPANQELLVLRNSLRRILRELSLPIPKNIDTLSRTEIEKACAIYSIKPCPLKITRLKYNPKLYKNLWELERLTGGPNIRWLDQAPSLPSAVGLVTDGRSFYLIGLNTVFLEYGDADACLENLVAELAHAHQANNRTVWFILVSLQDEIQTKIRAHANNKSYYQSQKDTYKIPGTMEYNAHKVVEPALWKILDNERPIAEEE